MNLTTINTKYHRKPPLIGILTSDGNRIFRGNHQNFIDLIQMGRRMGVLICVLTPRSFQSHRYVYGYVLQTNQQKHRWLNVKLPFPRVIYNRIPSRVVEKRKEEQIVLQRIQKRPDVHLFNVSFFNKWDLYQMLKTSENWRFMIPTTKLLDQFHTLKTMLKQHPVLFVKPINGKAGIGLMKIIQKNKHYFLTYQDQLGQKRYQARDSEQLWQLIQQHKQNKEYILQQAISLAKYRNHPCDFRVLIQKDAQGIWQVTGVGVRVAGKNAISTHVPMGGYIANVHQVLKTLFPNQHSYVYQKLKQKTKGIASFIEQSYGTLFGEMSMDIGIESSGRMWFFEANSKPMKFDEPTIRHLSLKRIIQYAQYLSQSPHAVGGSAR